MRLCNGCKAEKEINKFDKDRFLCKECRRDRVKKWRHDRGVNKRFIGEPKTDLINQKFGMLLVLGLNSQRKHKQFLWNCLCDCGKIKSVITGHLKSGQVQSCGCKRNRKKSESPNWKGTGDMSAVRWHIMKNKAKARGLEFSITPKYIWKLFEEQKGTCALSGVSLEFGTHKEDYGVASLDRIDSSKGYVKGNVQWVHRVVNFMKQSLSDEQLVEWCRLVVKHKIRAISQREITSKE